MVAAGILDAFRRQRLDHAERNLPLDGALVQVVRGQLGPRRPDRGQAVARVQRAVRRE